MASEKRSLLRLAYPIAVLALVAAAPAPARADFGNDVRQTFETDIPHFFQDDVPCAFGGKPTSGAKTSCKSADQPTRAADKNSSAPASSGTKPSKGPDAPSGW